MPDDHSTPSERAHIDPESTFSLIERARAGDEHALERLFAQTPAAAAAVGKRTAAAVGTQSCRHQWISDSPIAAWSPHHPD